MAELTLTREQQAVVENRGGSRLVSAAAGSGKTFVLVERLFRYVAEGCNINDFFKGYEGLKTAICRFFT